MKTDINKFTHCLRVQFYPGWYEDERISDVINYCKKFGFGNVMLFLNAEEYNVGHMTKEESKPWIKTLKHASEEIKKAGLTVSLNPWNCILHLDRGRKLKNGQDFLLMVDKNGKECTCVACPAGENWKNYYLDFITYLVSELKPDVFWLEDDFRLHNHAPLEYGGCFCEKHMQMYCEKLGENVSREQFVERMLRPGVPDPARKAWLDVSRETMAQLARDIGVAVRKGSPETEVGLMSSDPKAHGLEGRDWQAVMEGLSQGGYKIDRIHLPCYKESCGKYYYWAFHFTSMLCRAFLPKDTLIYPELENGAFSTFAKDSRFLRFQLESAAPLVLNGMTYDIYDFVGNGTVPSFGYGEEISSVTPYLQGIMNENIKFDYLTGVVIPISEKTSYHTHTTEGANITECITNDNWFAPHLGMAGINYRYSLAASLKNEIVAVSGQYLRNLSKDEIISLFQNNNVLCDGNTVLVLCDLGLGYLAGIKRAEKWETCTNRQSFEQAEPWNDIMGIPGYRATCQEQAGDYVFIEYAQDADVKVYTRTFNNICEETGPGIVCVNGHIGILPYLVHGVLTEQFHELRLVSLEKILCEFGKKNNLLCLTGQTGISPFLYKKEKEDVLILTNSTVTTFPKVQFKILNCKYVKIFEIDHVTGKKERKVFEEKDGIYLINEPFEYLSTKTFVLVKE